MDGVEVEVELSNGDMGQCKPSDDDPSRTLTVRGWAGGPGPGPQGAATKSGHTDPAWAPRMAIGKL